jgi:DNA-binding PadR family transcriptional regulator
MNPDMSQNCLPAEMLARPAVLLGRLGTAMKMESMERFEAAGFSVYHYGVDRSMLVGLLDQLEERGMIERRRDPNDRRRQMVKLVPAGRRQLAEFRKIVEKIEDDFLAPLDEEERAALHDLLLRVAAHRDTRFVPAQTSVS